MSNKNRRKKRNHFAEVDVHRASFGPVSVKAIYELYRVRSNASQEDFSKTSFRDMVEFLRSEKSQPLNQ